MFSHVVISWCHPSDTKAADELMAGAKEYLAPIPELQQTLLSGNRNPMANGVPIPEPGPKQLAMRPEHRIITVVRWVPEGILADSAKVPGPFCSWRSAHVATLTTRRTHRIGL